MKVSLINSTRKEAVQEVEKELLNEAKTITEGLRIDARTKAESSSPFITKGDFHMVIQGIVSKFNPLMAKVSDVVEPLTAQVVAGTATREFSEFKQKNEKESSFAMADRDQKEKELKALTNQSVSFLGRFLIFLPVFLLFIEFVTDKMAAAGLGIPESNLVATAISFVVIRSMGALAYLSVYRSNWSVQVKYAFYGVLTTGCFFWFSYLGGARLDALGQTSGQLSPYAYSFISILLMTATSWAFSKFWTTKEQRSARENYNQAEEAFEQAKQKVKNLKSELREEEERLTTIQSDSFQTLREYQRLRALVRSKLKEAIHEYRDVYYRHFHPSSEPPDYFLNPVIPELEEMAMDINEFMNDTKTQYDEKAD